MKVTFYVLQGSPVFEHHTEATKSAYKVSQTVALRDPNMLKPGSHPHL